jgi:hypothetical protein
MKTPFLKLMISSLFTAALLTLGVDASAGNADGQPKVSTGKQIAAYGWQDSSGGLHFRVTTPVRKSKAYLVTGTACAASKHKVQNLKAVLLEKGQDSVKLGPHGHCIFFRFKTNGHVDGFDFKTNSKTLTLGVRIDGKPLSTSQIHLGAKGNHPKKNPTVIFR